MSRIFIVLSIVILFSSCSFDYAQGDVLENLDETIPDIVLEDVSLYFIRGTTVKMDAKKIELYSNRKSQEMHELTFEEKNKKGEVKMFGSAKKAVVETDTNNVTILGDFFARSNDDEAEMKTEYLRWVDEERRMEGSPSSQVTIIRDDASKISGYNFIADAQERTLSLKQQVEGQLTVEE